jgi:DNA polymerase-3 subunit alpha
MAKGITKSKAEEIFELILKFGGYGFNKSHSTRYAIIAFQTAYMKTYFPVEYMAALLTFEMGSTDKIVEYIEECRRLTLPDGGRGIKVLPPDINESDKDFTPGCEAKAGVIRFGLCAVRGVGTKAVEAVIEQRQRHGRFTGLFDFCERVDLRTVQRSTIEALMKCGAFSCICAARAPLLHALERAVEMGQQSQDDKRSGQLNMFAATTDATVARMPAPALPDVPEFSSADLLKFEKELLGFYITSHPLTEHQAAIERYSTASTRECMTLSEGAEVTIGGMISAVRGKVAKSGRSAGQRWAIIEIEDLEGKIEGMCFAESFASIAQRYPGVLAQEQIVFMRGRVDRKRETPSIIVTDVIPIGEAISRLTTGLALKLDEALHTTEVITQLKPILKDHSGNCRVFLQISTADAKRIVLQLERELWVRPERALVDQLELALGNGNVQLVGDGLRRQKQLEQQKLFGEDAVSPELTEPAAAEQEFQAELDMTEEAE